MVLDLELRPTEDTLALFYELGGLDAERFRELENCGEVGLRDPFCFDVDQRSVGDTSSLGQLLLGHEVPAPQNPHIISQCHAGDYRHNMALYEVSMQQ
jgi:hypothetical protein